MSAVVLSALRMTLSIFLDKARRSLDEKLKDGDLNSLQLRSLITTKLESIETKLDGIALSPLRTSASFIRDGMFLLNDLVENQDKLDRYRRDEGVDEGIGFDRTRAFVKSSVFEDAFKYVVRFKSWLKRSDSEDGDTTWANNSDPGYLDLDRHSARKIIDAVSKLKSGSPKQFDRAMAFFSDAYAKATEVFNNQSLSLQDRVMATKLRIQCGLLLSIENPDLAKMCKLYLKDLHDLPSIVEIFCYDLEGGLLSKFNQAERHELFQSVSMMNFVLFRFLNSFTKEIVNVYDWPLIESDDWTYNPLIPDKTVLKALRQAEVEAPNLMFLKHLDDQLEDIDPTLVTVNSKGDLLLFRQRENPEKSELLQVSGSDVKVFYTFPEFTLVSFLAVNEDDFLLVFADNVSGQIPTGYLMYDVSVFYPNGDIGGIYKNFLQLDGSVVLAPTPRRKYCEVALCIPDKVLKKKSRKIQEEMEIRDKEKIQKEVKIQNEENIRGKIEIQNEETMRKKVAVQNEEKIQEKMEIPNQEKMQEKIEIPNEEKIREVVAIQNKEKIQEMSNLRSILVEIKMWEDTLATMTDKLQVVAIERYGFRARVFEKNGRLAREFELRNGEREACVAITFNSRTKELVVVSRVESDYFLSTYLPETGKRRHNVRLAHIGEDCQEIQLTSHCWGSIALITKEHVLYLQ